MSVFNKFSLFQKMRRNRRNRLWHMGLLFLVYSGLYVYSAPSGSTSTEDPYMSTSLSDLVSSTAETELETTLLPSSTRKPPHPHPTWRPLRENCTPPSIEQFPRPLMPASWRIHGGLIIHVCVAIFTFLGLAIVCDDYFVSSLDRLCEGEHRADLLPIWDIVIINSTVYFQNSKCHPMWPVRRLWRPVQAHPSWPPSS